ncbi:transcription initiation factor TFIID subunit 4-like [Anopheles maculipalpis]|uniref:transcription initiation factor TFIID subunit 4-like n=1 Tax=Anopheles maculipalpis TaxID=1496333 RepID=UPI002158D96A|nr:transcription initiation factor TFIID subunit 4-like [Anopheles maculipalpis]
MLREGMPSVGRRRPLSPKNKQLLAVCLCVLLSLPEAALGRKVALSRVTKPTGHRGYANADIAKLSYSPSHSAPASAAKPAAPVYSSAPVAPPAGAPHFPPAGGGGGGAPPSYGWNVPGAHGAPGAAGGVYPGAAAAGAAGTGLVASNVYRSHGHNATGGGFGGGLAHSPPGAYPSYPAQPAQGFPGAPVQHPGGGFPAPAYQPQPGGYVPQQPGGFPHQPSYVPGGHYDQGQPHYQGHPGQTVVHHYEQPSSGGSGIGTVLGAGVAGLAAGVGGAALYDALKPKDSKEEPAAATTAATTTTGASAAPGETPAPAPINPNGDAPLAPLPANPNGDVPLAPLPTEATPLATTAVAEGDSTTSTTIATGSSSSDNPLGLAPLAPMPDSSPATPADGTPNVSGSDVEVRHSALNVQPDLSASMAEPASGGATGTVHLSSAISMIALLPVIVKYLRF